MRALVNLETVPTVPAALNFVNVSKSLGNAQVLRGVSFEVRQGCFFGLAGINGAGKTTLIRCLLDLCSADSGSIAIFGVDSQDNRSRAPLAFVPERFIPPYYLTGAAFLRMMAGLRGDPYVEADALAMLDRLDLAETALARPVRAYSKGMTQKLGLASCFLADRPLVILDEPMSGLDPQARAQVKALLKEQRERGRTLFFTSHALADIEDICEEVAVLHDGRLRFRGTPVQMRAHAGDGDLESAFIALISQAGPVSA